MQDTIEYNNCIFTVHAPMDGNFCSPTPFPTVVEFPPYCHRIQASNIRKPQSPYREKMTGNASLALSVEMVSSLYLVSRRSSHRPSPFMWP